MLSLSHLRLQLSRSTLAVGLALCGLVSVARADEPAIKRHLAAIARVGPQGQNSAEARQACDALSNEGVDLLPRLLVGMDTSNVIVANWYRSVYDRIVDRALAQTRPAFPI